MASQASNTTTTTDSSSCQLQSKPSKNNEEDEEKSKQQQSDIKNLDYTQPQDQIVHDITNETCSKASNSTEFEHKANQSNIQQINKDLQIKINLKDSENTKPLPIVPNFPDTLPPSLESSHYSNRFSGGKDSTYFRQLYNQPLFTTLSSFSHVANFVKNPYELINNVDEFVKQATSTSSSSLANKINHGNDQAKSKQSRDFQQHSTTAAKISPNNQRLLFSPAAAGQEMKNFVSDSSSPSSQGNINRFDSQTDGFENDSSIDKYEIQIPLPSLPSIDCSAKRPRLQPLTIEEFKTNFENKDFSEKQLIERVFYGSIDCNLLRSVIWPYIFNLIDKIGSFVKNEAIKPGESITYTYIEHEDNKAKWKEMEKLYQTYQDQWKAIMPDQETRFSTFRERKSLIERDVIRCDRLHPFYIENQDNLNALTNILMTYMMYDFDIGYVQGMSDLAGPILFAYNGDAVKSFWIFVSVMKLFRRNFELTQKTIQYQLSCLYKLVKYTDPIFAQYLDERDTSNCFFAFRAIVCQFKRELMKEDEDDYSKVLTLWDSIWCVDRLESILEAEKTNSNQINEINVQQDQQKVLTNQQQEESESLNPQSSQFNYLLYNINQADSPRSSLTPVEKFTLALCLSMIRRERDIILANQFDSTDIHLHFVSPNQLAKDLNGFLEHAINIYSYLCNDFDINILTRKDSDFGASTKSEDEDKSLQLAAATADGYDLLSDYLIINASSAI